MAGGAGPSRFNFLLNSAPDVCRGTFLLLTGAGAESDRGKEEGVRGPLDAQPPKAHDPEAAFRACAAHLGHLGAPSFSRRALSLSGRSYAMKYIIALAIVAFIAPFAALGWEIWIIHLGP
jgi:hypothetical protein